MSMRSNAFRRTFGTHGVVPGDRCAIDGVPVTITATSGKQVFNGAQRARVVEFDVDPGIDVDMESVFGAIQTGERTYRFSWGSTTTRGHVRRFPELRGVRLVETVDD